MRVLPRKDAKSPFAANGNETKKVSSAGKFLLKKSNACCILDDIRNPRRFGEARELFPGSAEKEMGNGCGTNWYRTGGTAQGANCLQLGKLEYINCHETL